MPSSSALPRASRKLQSVALRASGSRPIRVSAISATAGPEMRTMPMPPRPAGVATAAMVSAVGSFLRSPLGMGRFVAVEHALDLPLLKDGEDVVDQPVEHQPGGEEEKEDAEDERHELHHLGLHR